MSNPNKNIPNFNKPGMKRPRKRMTRRDSSQQPNNNWLFWFVLGFIFLMLMSQSETMTTMGKYEDLSYNAFYRILVGEDRTRRIHTVRRIESSEYIRVGT
jgi:hypothetical protein